MHLKDKPFKKTSKPHCMKKNSLIALAGLFTALIIVSPSQAQIVRNSIKIDPSKSIASLKFGDVGKEEDKIALNALKTNHPRIFKDFTTNYSSALNIKVSKRSNLTFIWADTDGIKIRVSYDRRGRWQNTIRYYNQERLSPSIKELVLQNNPCWKISGVVEVQVANKTAHIVTIENSSEYKRIKVVNGEMEVYESFVKG
jgi:hypothetical protein